MENYADVLDAIVRDKKTVIQAEVDRKRSIENAERARTRKILEPLITVLTQIEPKLKHKAYVSTENYGSNPECKVSCMDIYAKFNGSILAFVTPGSDMVYVAERGRDEIGRGKCRGFNTATEAIPVFLEAISNMLIR